MPDDRARKVAINHLLPGMVLADDLIHRETGVLLLARNSVLTEKLIQFINQAGGADFCLVYEEMRSEETKDSPADLWQKIGYLEREALKAEQKSQPGAKHYHEGFIQFISDQAKQIYTSALQSVESYYHNMILDEQENLAGIFAAARQISECILDDPQVILQVALLKAFDNYTYTHAVNVAVYSAAIGVYSNWPLEKVQHIAVAGLLHDIGKVDVPPEILNKPDKLLDQELEIMRKHVDYSVARVAKFNYLPQDIVTAIAQHHERIDGSGYPNKLKGDQVHYWARILAIADIYDAVTTNRIYKKAVLPHEGAEILMGAAGQIDLVYLTIFMRHMPFYPLGSKVRLSTGEEGKVVKIFRGLPLRPVIEVTQNNERKYLDLSRELSVQIEQVL